MAEKLYTIPVNEAFDENGECPVCTMYHKLQKEAVTFMMGPSYMEDDIRMETNKKGFCKAHMDMLLSEKNRLGLALILKTHLDRQKYEAEYLLNKPVKMKGILKKPEMPEVVSWADKAVKTCYICERIQNAFPRYISTVLHLYKNDAVFREKYEGCKGFCQEHFGMLVEEGVKTLKGDEFDVFYKTTGALYTKNLMRLSDDLDWFTDKFDYRYKDAPWKNSKDAIERAVIKTNGILKD